jgi:predicted ribosomally synthesized peptide with nif11-like leader
MSQQEVDRFMSDLGRDPELLREFRRLADDLGEAVRWANARGYDFTRDEAATIYRRGELSDDDLDMVAGGWTDPLPPPPPTGGTP